MLVSSGCYPGLLHALPLNSLMGRTRPFLANKNDPNNLKVIVSRVRVTYYSPSHIAQITDFNREYCEESETFIEF